ncbi:MAG: hypothetical protein FWC76_00375 [Defluviitaleaceae bacterium]|nr:hypothetical protein [Defluviitaleaceae bacterium]
MRKLILTALFALFLVACGSEDYSQIIEEQAQIIEELQGTIAQQERVIVQNQVRIAQQHERIALDREEITAMQIELDQPDPFASWAFLHSLSDEEIIADLMDNAEIILQVTGGEGIVLNEEGITVGPWYVSVSGRMELSTHTWSGMSIDVLLTYIVQDGQIHWDVTAYWVQGIQQMHMPTQGGPSHFPRTGNVAVRFYDFDDNTFEGTYITEQIAAASWQEDVKRLMFEHTGIRLRDVWYEDRRLVVDLMPVEGAIADWGSTGGHIHTLRLIHSLASLPDVEEIKVLVGGVGGHIGSHFNFIDVFRVNQEQGQ